MKLLFYKMESTVDCYEKETPLIRLNVDKSPHEVKKAAE